MSFWNLAHTLYPPIAAAIIAGVAIWWHEREYRRRNAKPPESEQ